MAKGDLRTCKRRGGSWKQRTDRTPIRCGKRACQNPYWDRERQEPRPEPEEGEDDVAHGVPA